MIAYLPAAVTELIVPPKETPPQKLPCFGCVLDTIDRQRKIDAQMDNRSSRALKRQHMAWSCQIAQGSHTVHEGRPSGTKAVAYLERDADEEARVACSDGLLHISIRVGGHAVDLLRRLEQVNMDEVRH